jgi:hypothetical protein
MSACENSKPYSISEEISVKYREDITFIVEQWGLNYRLGKSVEKILSSRYSGDLLQSLKDSLWYLSREIKNIEDVALMIKNSEEHNLSNQKE